MKVSKTCAHLLAVSSFGALATMSVAAQAQVSTAKEPQQAQATGANDPASSTAAQAQGVQGADPTSANPQVTDMQGDIVVTGFRQSLQNAQNIKKNASEIVDSIVAEDIGKLPDNNLSEALQRVPGVQITRNHGEGSGIAIRGLSQVKTLLNGREVFSDSGRDLSLENVPAEILAGVDVYKNPSATLVEGGLGGVVNLKTRKPFDFKGFEASLSARMNYYDLASRSKPQVSALLSDRFKTGLGEIGVLFGAAVIKSAGRFDQNGAEPFQDRLNLVDFNRNGVFAGTAAPNNGVVNGAVVDAGDRVIAPNGGGDSVEVTDRTRIALNGMVQWKPATNLEFYAEGTYNKYIYRQNTILAYANRGPLQAADGVPFTFWEGTNVVKSGTYKNVEFTAGNNYFDRRAYTWQAAGGGSWDASPNFNLSTDIAYTKSRRVDDSGGLRTGNNGNTTGTFLDFDTSGVNGKADQVLLRLRNFNFGNTQLYRFIDSSTAKEIVNGDGFAARLDGTYKFDDSPLTSISIGGRFARRGVDRQQGSRSHFSGPQPITLWPEAISPIGFGQDFFRGTDVPNPIRDVQAPQLNFARNTAEICRRFSDAVCYPVLDPRNAYSQSERTYAAYGQVNFNFATLGVPIDGNVGGRYVKTQLHTNGVITSPASGAVTPIDRTNDYENFLPSANVRVKFTDKLFLRLAAAKQLTRPDFSNLSPTLNVSSVAATGILNISAGNPDLRPLRSTSYDASVEYYFSRNGYMYLSGFLKKVNGFIQNVVTRQTVNIPGYAADSLADINQPLNGNRGTIKGFEVGTQTFLDFLPGAFSGLGVQANYTFVDSSAPGPVAGTTLPLQGLSKNSYNIVGFYEKSGFRARLAYTWRDDYVESTAGPGSGALPIFVQPYDQLDGSIGYSVNDHFDISIDASNITGAVNHTYFGETIRPRFNNIYDRRIGLVVRIKR